MTTDWIERIYRCSMEAGLTVGDTMERLFPASRPANLKIGTGRATFCGDGSPLTQVSWLAYRTKFDPAELDQVTEFFGGRATNWEYNVTPFSSPDLLPALIQRGWTKIEYETLLARSLEDLSDLPTSDVEVRLVGPESTGVWADVATRGFFSDGVPPTCENLADLVINTKSTIAFLADLDGQPAAAATLSRADRAVYLGGAATLPEFRNRGAQTALLSARLRHAAEIGCDLALCECLPGSQSQRNQERAGFAVVFNKLVLTKPQNA